MAVRKSRIHNKSILFFQMQVVNPNTVMISFTGRHISTKLFEKKVSGIILGSAAIISESQKYILY